MSHYNRIIFRKDYFERNDQSNFQKKTGAFIHIHKTAGKSIKNALKDEDVKTFHGKKLLRYRKYLKNHTDVFSFSFIRNPYDRFVSLYYYTITKDPNKKLRKYVQENYRNFTEFCLKFSQDYYLLNLDTRFDTQKSVLYNDNQLMVDYVGRFENLQSTFNFVLKSLGLASRPLPFKNKSEHKHYQKEYTSRTKKIIREYYKDDFETFHYPL